MLRHERIPFVSYPYEWTFSMLKDAALLQLDLLLARARARPRCSRTATPVQRPVHGRAGRVFVDVGSFERLRAGRAVGRLPPVLHALPVPAAAAGAEGRALPAVAARLARRASRAAEMRGLMSAPRPLPPRPADPRLPARAARARATRTAGGEVKAGAAPAPAFGKELIRRQRAQAAQARRAAATGSPPAGVWTGVRRAQQLQRRGRRAQGGASSARRPRRARRRLVWDLGANDGRYSRIAAEQARDACVAIDADHGAARAALPRAARRGRRAHPAARRSTSPIRRPASAGAASSAGPGRRGRPDLVLALALVHHLAITRQRAGQRRSSTGSPGSARRS